MYRVSESSTQISRTHAEATYTNAPDSAGKVMSVVTNDSTVYSGTYLGPTGGTYLSPTTNFTTYTIPFIPPSSGTGGYTVNFSVTGGGGAGGSTYGFTGLAANVLVTTGAGGSAGTVTGSFAWHDSDLELTCGGGGITSQFISFADAPSWGAGYFSSVATNNNGTNTFAVGSGGGAGTSFNLLNPVPVGPNVGGAGGLGSSTLNVNAVFLVGVNGESGVDYQSPAPSFNDSESQVPSGGFTQNYNLAGYYLNPITSNNDLSENSSVSNLTTPSLNAVSSNSLLGGGGAGSGVYSSDSASLLFGGNGAPGGVNVNITTF